MTEAVEFEVPEAGAPSLGDEASPYDDQAQAQQAAMAAPVVAGWTQDEAAQVVGGMVANILIVAYAMRWQAPPPLELAPAIAGDPKTEFPLLGMGLAPILDLVAPKGSAAAIGVSLTAGIGELVAAIARRAPVLNVPPKREQRPAPAPAAAAEAAAPATGDFRFHGDQLRVLQAGQGAYDGMGLGV